MAPHEDPEIEDNANHEGEEEMDVEGAEEEEEEEEEEEDLVDPRETLKEKCSRSQECKALSSELNKCNKRVEAGDLVFEGETCTEELFNFMHCVDHCVAPAIMKVLK